MQQTADLRKHDMTPSIKHRVPSRLAFAAAAAASIAVLAGCSSVAYDRSLDMPRAPSAVVVPAASAPVATAVPAAAPVHEAIARLTDASGRPAGTARLKDTAGGVEIVIEAQGLAAGQHGFHIHANGACAPGPDAATGRMVAFGAAGGHYDPGMSHNHGRPGEPATAAHAGELPNLQAGADGRASLRYVNANVTVVAGPMSAMGRTLVVHEKQDDYQTDPAGDSGGRLLCGVIEPAQPSTVQGRATIDGADVFPEGIAIDARNGDAYVGSSSEGHIYRIAAGAQKAELLQRGGSSGRQNAYGMRVDSQGRLWVAGGPAATVSVIDVASGAMLGMARLPAGPVSFLNDMALGADGYLYVTDSARPVLYRIRVSDQNLPPVLETWLDLSGTPIGYVPNQFNLNGIVASSDGRWLLAIQTITGQLWRIDTRTKTVSEVRIDGGDLKAGDGLVLRGANDLFVIRNSENEIVRVALAGGWDSGRVVQRLADPRLHYPTTAAVAGGNSLMVVNAQSDKQKSPPPLLPFDVLRISLPQ